jgi:hypothetical protein
VEELKNLLATGRGRIVAGVLGAVVLLGGGFVVLSKLGASGTSSAATPPLVVPHRKPVVHKSKVPDSPVPPSVQAQLIDHEVVVVEVYDPGTTTAPVIDDIEAGTEAKAGAKLAGAGFATINVHDDLVMQALGKLVTVNADPYLFILNRSQKLLFQRAGYLDRETVGQAVASALRDNEAERVPFGGKDGLSQPYDSYWQGKADQLVCDTQEAVRNLSAPVTLAGQRKLAAGALGITRTTLSALRALHAVGPAATAFQTFLAAYARLESDQATLVAMLHRTPIPFNSIPDMNLRIAHDQEAIDSTGKDAGVACFVAPVDATKK